MGIHVKPGGRRSSKSTVFQVIKHMVVYWKLQIITKTYRYVIQMEQFSGQHVSLTDKKLNKWTMDVPDMSRSHNSHNIANGTNAPFIWRHYFCFCLSIMRLDWEDKLLMWILFRKICWDKRRGFKVSKVTMRTSFCILKPCVFNLQQL